MWSFLTATLAAAVIAPAVIAWYKAHGWVDNPEDQRHVKVLHQHAVPRGGGLVIFGAVLISSCLFLSFDKHLIGIMFGAAILVVTGFLDDLYNIHPFYRLAAGLLASLCVVAAGIGIAYVGNPLGGDVIHLNQPQLALDLFGKTRTIWILADLFAVLFIVWNMNIVNWSKGVDGQMPGFVSIAALFIGILSYRFIDDPTQFGSAQLAFIVSGAFAGLLIWNFYPQRMLPGYGAGSLAGYFLSVLAIVAGAKVATTLMVLAVPTADAIFAVTRRVIAGKSPWWGDRGHLHHKLMDVLGWGRRRIAIFYWLMSLLMGLLSLQLNTLGKVITMGVVCSMVFSFLIWAKWRQSQK
ncbi:MAG TPA: MraY family glycosyltransferase [Vitreimonas sp.]|nr:MraY family glycosyltransferase [Vitreimonas sp.]